MPRDHAQINLGIWNDPDFRALPPPAQHLYLTLWTHPGLSYCGVVDWRPGRIAAASQGWAVGDLQTAASCLQARHFIVIDETSEECLIRSWVRWDGLMKQPRLAVSYANAYSSVGSNLLRGVIIDELVKLKEREPGLAGLGQSKVVALLDLPRVSAKDSVSVSDPFGDGFTHSFGPGLAQTPPDVSGSVSVPPTPFSSSLLPTPSPTSRPAQQKRGSRLPKDWTPPDDLWAQIAKERADLDLQLEHENFSDYWNGKAGRDAIKVDWPATWRKWMRNARPPAAANGHKLQAVPAYETPPAPPLEELNW